MSQPEQTPPPAFRRTAASGETPGSPAAISSSVASALARRASALTARRQSHAAGAASPEAANEKKNEEFPADGSIVIDLGARFTRVGVVGELVPRDICQTPPAVAEAMLKARVPADVEKTAVAAFMKLFSLHAFGAASGTEPVVLLRNPAANEVFIETLASAARQLGAATSVFNVCTSVSSAWSVGCHTGIVVDVGYTSTRVTPVLLSQPISHATQFSRVGASEVYASMEKQIADLPMIKQLNLGKHLERHMVEEVLYRHGAVAPGTEQTGPSGSPSRDDFLKAAYPVHIKTATVGVCPASCLEQLFVEDRGEDSGYPPIPTLILKAVLACEESLRREVCQCIIVRGGISELHNFESRLAHELEKQISEYSKRSVENENNSEIVRTKQDYLPKLFSETHMAERNVFGGSLAACMGAVIRFRSTDQKKHNSSSGTTSSATSASSSALASAASRAYARRASAAPTGN